MKNIKLTSKLIITIIIVTLITMFGFEMGYNRMMHKDYAEIYNKQIQQEEEIDKLYILVFQMLEYLREGKVN